jgi:MFS family permease
VLILGVALGLVLGIAAGGRIENLVYVRLRWIWLLFLAAVVRFGTEFLLVQGNPLAEQFRLPLLASAYTMLLVALYRNRGQPGISMAFVGILGNAIAIVANGGRMLVWEPSLRAAGFNPDEPLSPLHVVVPAPLDASFLQHFGFLGDIFLSAGLAFFLFATVVRSPGESIYDLRPSPARPSDDRLARVLGYPDGAAVETGPATAAATAVLEPATTLDRLWADFAPETGVTPALAEAAALERPVVLGGGAAGLTIPSSTSTGLAVETAAERERRLALPARVLERAKRHPYVRLALNGSFSAMWTGQLISLYGDRMHQIAMAALVLTATGSLVAVGLVFLAATLPNLLLGPIAGTFVDRWDQKEVMVVSDLLRASLVLLVPIAAVTNLVLVYPLVFLITSISIFFRPARTAVIPRIVAEDELLTANSATWVAETLADVIGYPLAGLFVAFLGSALPLAFWFDAATYVASAVLIATMAVPKVADVLKTADLPAAASGETAPTDQPATDVPAGVPATAPALAGVRGFFDELVEGYRFLRGETVLFANTLQAVVAQFTVGVLLTLTPSYARDVLDRGPLDWTAAYAFLETGIGVGNLIGGFVIGLLGVRLAKGRMVVAGYAIWGLSTVLLALTGNLGLALGLFFGSGIANMVYVIPSQTLFQERTPPNLIGRVVGFRFSLVFGSMSLAMAVSGVLGAAFGVAPVIGFFGMVTLAAGLAGLLVPAVRDA